MSAEIEGFREKWNAAEDKIRNLQFEAKKKAQALKRRESQVHAMKKAQSMQLEAKSPRSDGVVKAEEKQQASDLDSQLDDEQQKGATTKMKSGKSRADQYQWHFESVTPPDESHPLPDWDLSSDDGDEC